MMRAALKGCAMEAQSPKTYRYGNAAPQTYVAQAFRPARRR